MNTSRKLQEGKYINVFYHQEKNYIHAWIQAQPNNVDDALLEHEFLLLQQSIIKKQPQTIVLNIKEYKISIAQHFKNWLSQAFFMPFAKIGVQRLSLVFGENIYNSINFEEATNKRELRSYSVAAFSDEQEAIKWGLQAQKLVAVK